MTSTRIRWGWHAALVAITAGPMMALGVWLFATARGGLPQVPMLFGLIAIGAGLVDALVTTLVASRVGTSLPRLLVVHSVGLVVVTTSAFALVG
ncbi:MAG: hypothetical protein JNM69_26855 [Archangium sp.]|nr:hypothetical protein [Archangium sp.]